MPTPENIGRINELIDNILSSAQELQDIMSEYGGEEGEETAPETAPPPKGPVSPREAAAENIRRMMAGRMAGR